MVDETIAVPHYVYKLSCSVPGVGDYVGRTKRIGKREFEHKQTWSDPEFRAKRLAQMGDPGHRAKIREARARQKFSPESIKKRSDSVRATWAAKRAAREGQK